MSSQRLSFLYRHAAFNYHVYSGRPLSVTGMHERIMELLTRIGAPKLDLTRFDGQLWTDEFCVESRPEIFMKRQTSLTVKSVQERLNTWVKKQPEAIVHQVRLLPLRQDMVTLLEFIRDHKVVGTQSTGNMPLKAVREVTARFCDPPRLTTTIGDQTFHLRSEADLWPLYFLHILADVGGLIKTTPSRRWQLTPKGQQFLDASPVLQVPFLLTIWWFRVNWLVAYPMMGMGEALPGLFSEATLALLRSIPTAKVVSFAIFSDILIEMTGLTWTARDSIFATRALHTSIERMVIRVLADFGMVKRRYEEEPLGKGTISKLVAFEITPQGTTLLNALVTLGVVNTTY